MPAIPLKPATTYQQQIDTLRARGIDIENDITAQRYLAHNSYYRISGYFYQFMEDDLLTAESLSFDAVMRIYEFDREMRLILMRAIEPVEIYVRTQVAYVFSHINGVEGHYDCNHFKSTDRHSAFLFDMDKLIIKNHDSLFVDHHIRKYGGRMPLWAMVELMSLTTLSRFFANIRPPCQDEIARKIGCETDFLANWLHGLSTLRNKCAHYGRLYNVAIKPRLKLGRGVYKKHRFSNDSLFAYIYILTLLIPEYDQRERMVLDVIRLVNENIEYVDPQLMGFPRNYHEALASFIS